MQKLKNSGIMDVNDPMSSYKDALLKFLTEFYARLIFYPSQRMNSFYATDAACDYEEAIGRKGMGLFHTKLSQTQIL